jgi:hypothetical protein
MQYTYENTRSLPTERLIEIYDARSAQTDPGLSFFREEIHRREQQQMEHRILELTNSMATMTRRIEIATYIAVACGIVSLCIAVFK